MRMRRIALGMALAGASVAWAGGAAARDCDRACVAAITDQALAAFQAGAPGKVLRGARITENGREVRLADSQLHAIRSVTSAWTFSDPASGVAGLLGAADAAGGAEVFTIRLKLKGGAVTEAETLVVRRGEASAFLPQGMADAMKAMDGDQPPAPPEQLQAVAAAFLDNAEGAAGGAPCVTWENGQRRAGCGGLTGAPGASVRDRRVTLTDPGRGLVWIIGVADAPPAAGRREPRSVLASWLLKVSGGHVQQAVVLMRNAPLGASAGWALPKPKKK